MESRGYTERAYKLIFYGGAIFFVVLLLRFLWVPMLPFALSWLVSLPVREAARRVSERTKIPFGVAAVCCLLLCLAGVGGLLWLGIRALCGEILDLHGDCGGYNLHLAWTTGRIAGNGAYEYLNK